MIILSCDIGKQGALVVGRYTEEGLNILHILSMPESNKEKMEKIKGWHEKYKIDIFLIEQQLGRSGNSAQANFTIGRNVGVLQCISDLLDLSILSVYPQTWQTILKSITPLPIFNNQKLDVSKKKSLSLALSSFPSLTLATKTRSSVKYLDGIADAVCMQLWYISKYSSTSLPFIT